MSNKKKIKELEKRKQEIIGFTNQLDEQLQAKQIDNIEYLLLLNEHYPDKTKDELLNEIDQELEELQSQAHAHRHEKVRLGIIGGVLLVFVMLGIYLQQTPHTPTGLEIKEKDAKQALDYNQEFEQNTQTQIELRNITSLKISRSLQGTRAVVKLKADGVEYVVVDIINEQASDLITGNKSVNKSE